MAGVNGFSQARLILDNGAFINITNGGYVVVENSAANAITRTSGYIKIEANTMSKLKWSIGTNTSAHVFPFVTAAGVYVPFTLQVTAGDIGHVAVSTYPTAANNTPYPATVTHVNILGVDNSANVVDRFWQIDKDGPSGTATLTFQAALAEVGSITTLRAQRWNSTTNNWDAPLPGQTSTATSVTVPGVTTFSPWAVSGNNAPLPVELISFTAKAIDKYVELDWITASERNNDYFTIQRSKGGINFLDIATVDAGPTGSIAQEYSYTDLDALPGKSYYRLKQTDLDGTVEFLDIRMVQLDELPPGLTAYPNPVTNGKLFLDFNSELKSEASITISDLAGKVVFSTTVAAGTRFYTIDLSRSPAGAYMLRAFSTQSNFQQIVVIR
ncbi:T9SS type A sorting domain-containing protein [Fulvivirgaceae bacterium PWU5]|uniref:T9SS type A sorting domain-containing protein n=1 Tax=Dawidia cretensis TaxID=2782350 RepID=A0AAP2DWR2_9BACT|nr:T9SS type A sorting domain-containing protein [Dawidia cretensis]MBT1708811.1 T9SS type A sorting domain-containing protein [Dawidia cretensis]